MNAQDKTTEETTTAQKYQYKTSKQIFSNTYRAYFKRCQNVNCKRCMLRGGTLSFIYRFKNLETEAVKVIKFKEGRRKTRGERVNEKK